MKYFLLSCCDFNQNIFRFVLFLKQSTCTKQHSCSARCLADEPFLFFKLFLNFSKLLIFDRLIKKSVVMIVWYCGFNGFGQCQGPNSNNEKQDICAPTKIYETIAASLDVQVSLSWSRLVIEGN